MRVLCLVLLFPAMAMANTPADRLGASLARAETAYAALEKQVETLGRRQQNRLNQVFHAQTTLLQLAGWPQGLVTAHTVLEGGVHPPVLIHAARRQAQDELQDLAKKLENYLALQAQAKEQLAELRALRSAYAGGQKHYSALERKALAGADREATSLAQSLAAALSAPSPQGRLPQVSGGRGVLPVAGRLVFGYHDPKAPLNASEGLTFEAPAGSRVTAVSTGQVLYAGPFRNLGGLVIMKTGRLHYVYAGLDEVLPTVGHTLTAGTPIGTLPLTTPARLYLEVRRRGHPVNPVSLLGGQ